MSKAGGKVVYVALAINIAIAACKFVAALISRSSAMLAEAAHSLADTANQIFLLIGMRRATKVADEKHPFGYGTETYFWSFIVALCIFTVGSGFSIREGVHKIIHRHDTHAALGDPRLAYLILLVSMVLEGYSMWVALREFQHARAGRSIRETLTDTRDPTVITVLFEDSAAMFGLVVAFAGLWLARATGELLYDGLASVIVGVVLGLVAFILARYSKALLIGRSASENTSAQITEIVAAHPDVVSIVHQRTLHFGPDEVMLGIKIHFRRKLDIATLERAINDIEASLRKAMPILRRIYVEPGFDERPSQPTVPAVTE